jgi:hypothetical protein
MLFARIVPLASNTGTATPVVVDAGCHANICRAVGTNIVFVGTELSSLSGDTLELLLGWSVRIPNIHELTTVAHGNPMVLPDDVLAFFAAREPATGSELVHNVWKDVVIFAYRAKPTPRLLPMLSRRILLETT